MNRRSVLRWLGLAPVAAPAAVAAAGAPVLSPIDYSALGRTVRIRIGNTGAHVEILPDGRSRVVFDASRLELAQARIEKVESNIAAIDAALSESIDGAVANHRIG